MPAAKISDGELLNRLTRVFQDFGYEGASLSRISQATGLERASLYHRFPQGKDQMAQAVLKHVSKNFAEELLAPLSGSGTITARIRETGCRLQNFYQEGGVSCVLDTLSLRDGSSTLHKAVADAYDFWRNAFAAVAHEAGLSQAASRKRAEEAIMSIHGALVLARATGDRKPFKRTIERLPELLCGIPEDSQQ